MTDSDSRRVLLIDSYDSFTYNLAALCRRSFPGCEIHIIRNDTLTPSVLCAHLSHFSAVVVGPGPGSPDKPADVGVLPSLWTLPPDALLPIFGVCLGLQSLVLAHGGTLKRLRVVKHGQISPIAHTDTDLFAGVGAVHAVRYHSLHTTLAQGGPLEALAHADHDDGEGNGQVLMAVRHTSKPFWAVQFHPESVKTHGGGGRDLLCNFWTLASRWWSSPSSARRARAPPQPWTAEAEALFGPSWPALRVHTPPSSPRPLRRVLTRTLDSVQLSAPEICELLGVGTDASAPFVLLDSAAKPGRYSIIGALTPSSTRLTHSVGDAFIRVHSTDGVHTEPLAAGRDVWSWIASFMRTRRFAGGVPTIPFWGGLVGALSYELGVATLGVAATAPRRAHGRHPDVNLVFVERSVVLDTETGKAYVQSLLPEDPWVEETSSLLLRAADTPNEARTPSATWENAERSPARVTLPDATLYKSRIRACQDFLASGNSYELCLTAQTRVHVPAAVAATAPSSSSWALFKSTRARNPAPYAAYLRLAPSTLLSSSPERFLSFSRPPGTTCELRPIKGTLRKGPGITRAVAEDALAGSVKEVAENLMIVDLIRHDLHGVVGDDVSVRAFCAIEEYETVWQMVSVIEGRLSPGAAVHGPDLDSEGELGWEVLRRSLPPGSMTGAPKKRSVEILQTLEDDERGLYSGVIGYWDVGGGGDWAVTIRSCFHLDGNDAGEWRLGAGGAITALSDVDAEWDEMVLKLQGVLRAFGPLESSSGPR